MLTPFGVQDGKVASGFQNNTTYHITQAMSWVRGKHELKLGWDYRRLKTTAVPISDVQIRYRYHAGYLQDNWKLTNKLTLNLGFRYEVPIGFHFANDQFSSVDLTIPNAAAGGLPGALVFVGAGAGRIGEKRFYPTDFSNFGPRAGLAYRIDDRTVLRAGYGIFHQTLGNGGCGSPRCYRRTSRCSSSST